MSAHASASLLWFRTLSQRFFLKFGLHCATHQIRIILVSCVVITSLFYPALAIYSSSHPRSLSIIDTFIPHRATSGFEAQKDLIELWSHHDTLRTHEDAVSRAKCGVGRVVRVERILVQSASIEDDSALTHQILLSTLDFERRLQEHILDTNIPCLKRSTGSCFVLSPLLFWNYDKDTILADTRLLDTINASKNVSLGGFLVTPQMVLAGRGSDEPHVAGSKFDYATYLALTYFFPQSDCLSDSKHTTWLQAVYNIIGQDTQVPIQLEEPTIVALEYDPSLSKPDRWSVLSAAVYLAYLGFFTYVAWSMGKMNAVHSRLGVTFTALVEIAVSTITSLSVCALVGFRVTMVPWEILPIVIVFVGAENMFNLVDAVGKTSVALSVKQRIAEGLSKAGTSNTLKVISYNAILGIIAVFSAGAVRQFCSFAIVVLVAHWFLAHTFFMAVLSIDIQRLELDELLRHNTSTLAPQAQTPKDLNIKKPSSAYAKLVFTVKSLLKGRAATNVSLFMLLAITATLYYATYTASSAGLDHTSIVSNLGPISQLRSQLGASGMEKSATWHIWKALNPTQTPLLHLRLELPAIIAFGLEGETYPSNPPRPRFSIRTINLVFWFLKIIAMPIAVTTGALWLLLLYLLKNAELLEAQKGSPTAEAPELHEDMESKVLFSTLPRSFSSDVELIAANAAGSVVVSVGLHNEVSVWRTDEGTRFSLDITQILLRAPSTSSAISTVTSVAVDDAGLVCALGTGAGVIAIWELQEHDAQLLPPLSLSSVSASVADLRFMATSTSKAKPGLLTSPNAALFAAYENGTVVKWTWSQSLPSAIHFSPTRNASLIRGLIVPIYPSNHILVAFCLNDGTVEVLDTRNDDILIQSGFYVQAGNQMDVVSKVSVCHTEMGGQTRIVIAAATDSGVISLWDGLTTECISILEETYGRVSCMRMMPIQSDICRRCGHLPLESLAVAFSVDHVIQLYRLYISDQTRRCSCTRRPLSHISSRDSLGRRSRSNSVSSQVGSASPSIPRARLATSFENSSFPVSGHGVHSRRVSEKEPGRRSSELLVVPFPGEEQDPKQDSLLSRQASLPKISFWRDALVMHFSEVTCERGGWDIDNQRIVGIRRRPRMLGQNRNNSFTVDGHKFQVQGLTSATLERWEFLALDLDTAKVQNVSLAALSGRQKCHGRPTSPRPGESPRESIPRIPFTRVSTFSASSACMLAGFGNTVGIVKFLDSLSTS